MGGGDGYGGGGGARVCFQLMCEGMCVRARVSVCVTCLSTVKKSAVEKAPEGWLYKRRVNSMNLKKEKKNISERKKEKRKPAGLRLGAVCACMCCVCFACV